MIDLQKLIYRKYCREPIELIENYDSAVSDNDEVWELHHRDEIRNLPSGMIVRRSKKDLIEAGRYFDCPANELIFLKRSEHHTLHKKGLKRPGIGGHKKGTPCANVEWLKGRHWKVINGRRTWIKKEVA